MENKMNQIKRKLRIDYTFFSFSSRAAFCSSSRFKKPTPLVICNLIKRCLHWPHCRFFSRNCPVHIQKERWGENTLKNKSTISVSPHQTTGVFYIGDTAVCHDLRCNPLAFWEPYNVVSHRSTNNICTPLYVAWTTKHYAVAWTTTFTSAHWSTCPILIEGVLSCH